MALQAPSGFDVVRLRDAIRTTYERVAHEPRGVFHFHRGRNYAVERLGYDATELDSLPPERSSSFAGVEPAPEVLPIASAGQPRKARSALTSGPCDSTSSRGNPSDESESRTLAYMAHEKHDQKSGVI
jgi:hypothetical protein